ncbi:MAG: non-canonical purine NTP pyrophosphatase [bacterium]|nr:non-canonical purine NTP pyrophosphatase [bacterium]
MNNKILIATGNKHKKEKLAWIVKDYFRRIDYPDSLGLNISVNENGNSFRENAEIKAKEYSLCYKGFVTATDGGVIIPVLGDNWNPLRTKRFAGENIDDFERIRLLLELMKDKKGDDRIMTWNEALAIAKNGKILFSCQAEGVKGLLEENFNKKKYKPGIWVCSVWFFPQYKKNFFDLSDEEVKQVEISWKRLFDATHSFLDNFKIG